MTVDRKGMVEREKWVGRMNDTQASGRRGAMVGGSDGFMGVQAQAAWMTKLTKLLLQTARGQCNGWGHCVCVWRTKYDTMLGQST